MFPEKGGWKKRFCSLRLRSIVWRAVGLREWSELFRGRNSCLCIFTAPVEESWKEAGDSNGPAYNHHTCYSYDIEQGRKM